MSSLREDRSVDPSAITDYQLPDGSTCRVDRSLASLTVISRYVGDLCFGAISATFVDPEQAQADLDAQAERIRLAKEGPSLFDSGDEAAALASEHDAGEHRELVDGCPECQHERELVEAGE